MLWTASGYRYLLFQLQTRKANMMNNWHPYERNFSWYKIRELYKDVLIKLKNKISSKNNK